MPHGNPANGTADGEKTMQPDKKYHTFHITAAYCSALSKEQC